MSESRTSGSVDSKGIACFDDWDVLDMLGRKFLTGPNV